MLGEEEEADLAPGAGRHAASVIQTNPAPARLLHRRVHCAEPMPSEA